MKSRRTIWVAAAMAGVAAIYGGWCAYLAWRDLVTLDVRNMDVRAVVKKIERQTWETILVEKSVEGKVTLNVRRAPLPEVLRLIASQTFSRSTVIYPLYTNGKSLAVLQQALRGEVDAATHGWTNLQSRGPMGGGPMFGRGGFPGPNPMPPAQRVSLNLVEKDAAFAALAFNRFAQARVVPEDGTSATITLTLNNATVSGAVAHLARKANRKWTTLYVLQGGFGGGPPDPGGPQFADRGNDRPRFGEDGPRSGPGGPRMSDEKREEMRKQREALEEELKQALPAQERQKREAAQQEREKQMQEMVNMTDEQRRDRMMQMGARNISQMNRERLMNSTPEQRAQMNRMRPGGPGGPGGPGPGGPPR
jgi:hypothetical protein